MNSDKHLYEIFEAYPQWVFELTGRPWPGPCRFQSVTIKAIQRSADGVLIPEVTGEAILVVEFQMYRVRRSTDVWLSRWLLFRKNMLVETSRGF